MATKGREPYYAFTSIEEGDASKAGVEFHMYTADRFLELYESGEKHDENRVDAVKEVRKIRELEERRKLSKPIDPTDVEAFNSFRSMSGPYVLRVYLTELLQRIMEIVRMGGVDSPASRQLEYLFRQTRELLNIAAHGNYEDKMQFRILGYLEEIQYLLQKLLALEPERFSRSSYSEMIELTKKLSAFIRDFRKSPNYS